MRLRLVLQPLAQFALGGALSIAFAETAIALDRANLRAFVYAALAALALTYTMQMFWWINIRTHRLTDGEIPHAGALWSTGATIGTAIAIAFAAARWWMA